MSRKRSSVVIIAAIGVLAFLLVLPCGMKVRDGEGWVRSAVSARQIGEALAYYHKVNGQLPPPVVRDKEGRPLYSWRVAMAREMYESRNFSPMPIFADALEEAGCQDEQILEHCRAAKPHMRGCWLVDSILGRA